MPITTANRTKNSSSKSRPASGTGRKSVWPDWEPRPGGAPAGDLYLKIKIKTKLHHKVKETVSALIGH